MLKRIKYTIIFLLVVTLCASFMIVTVATAQTCGYGNYWPSYGYFASNTPIESPAEAATPAQADTPACTPAEKPGYAKVYGTAAYSNGTIVPGAIVQIKSPSGAQYSATTDADGHYEIGNVKYDSYTVRFTKDRYVSPDSTLAVDTASVKRDVTLPISLQASSMAAGKYSDIKSWYATHYTQPASSGKSVIYDRSGHIVRVITGITCQI